MSDWPRHSDTLLDAGLFHLPFYQHQRSERFSTLREAFDDFVDHGASAGLSPHPLFDVAYYLRRNPVVAASGANPALHYLLDGWREGRDPHPLFDNDWYLTQLGAERPTCPLTHYLKSGGLHDPSPNPLFDTRFYANEHADITQAGLTPLEHYVLYGRNEERLPTPRLRAVLSIWRDASTSLKRGHWRREHTLWVLATHEGGQTDVTERVVQHAYQRQRMDVRLLVDGTRPPLTVDPGVKHVCLDELGVHLSGLHAFRLSSLRMLLFALTSGVHRIDLWQNADEPRVANAFMDLGLPVTIVPGLPEEVSSHHVVAPPVKLPPEHSSLRVTRAAERGRRIVVACADWSLSGVHTVAEALGQELIARGWDFSLLFTHGTIGVLDRTTEGQGLPRVPYAFLDTSACHSRREQWATLIRHLEWRAPCVMLATFDDFANAVAPALSDHVGVVGWLQSDEDHYYESAYRLGPYWNAMVGVSQRIVDRVTQLNPSFESRAHVIHNSTISRDELRAPVAPVRGPGLRLIYVGRMVQYQKRVLDIITLVHHLEQRRVAYQLTLIGGFPDDDVEEPLRRALAGQLATGIVRLTGPLNRAQVVSELRAHNVFVLLSDFEGMPVSLIEALAHGCVAAVARAESGIPDLVTHDHNGLVFDHRDYDAWAEALDALVRNPARMAAMSDNARRTVLDRFTVESMASQFEDVFSTVLRQIDTGTWRRPPALTWKSPVGDVSVPPSMSGTALD